MTQIANKLKNRTTTELMTDILVLRSSNIEGSTVVFCLALTELESRLSEDEYNLFESSL